MLINSLYFSFYTKQTHAFAMDSVIDGYINDGYITPRGYEYQIRIGNKPPKQEIFYNGAKKAINENKKYNFYYTINNNN